MPDPQMTIEEAMKRLEESGIMPSPTPVPTPSPTKEKVKKKIKDGWIVKGQKERQLKLLDEENY